jgi:tRNA pseudouridine55 synthase
VSTAEPGAGGSAARRRWRTVDGLVLLDKPTGLSSNHALQRVRRLLQAAKGGHAGTLDPMATGMLPLAFGQGTKACGALLGATKAYRARLRLGAATDTGDAEGSVIRECPVPPCDSRRIEEVLATFVGVREQQPPMYSALKRDGRPLYELARAGIEVERAPRRIEIRRLRLLAAEAGGIDFEVECSKGTYVRVLGADIAAALGTCGHLEALRRLWVEPFEPWPMVTMETIERWAGEGEPPPERPDWLLPVDTAFRGRPRVDLDEIEALHLKQGRVLTTPAACAPGQGVRAYGPGGAFLGLVEATPTGTLRVERLFVDGAATAGTAGGS